MVRDLLRRLIKPPPKAQAPAPTPWSGMALPARGEDPRPLEVETPLPGSLLLDIREPGELASGVAADAMLLPMDLVPHHLDLLPKDRPITVYCAAGARSLGVAHWLRERGFHAVSLEGGLSSLRYGGVPMREPAGAGRFVRFNGKVAGAALNEDIEVIEQLGERVRGRVMDRQGYWVLVEG